MSDITELERRISAALDRIGSGLDGISAGASTTVDDGEVAALREAIEDERTANAQLEERVRAIREKHENSAVALADEIAVLRDELSKSAAEVKRLENINNQLRSNNNALRTANETGLGDPDLINLSIKSELESLQISRDADRKELDAILGELKPLAEGRADA